MCPTSLVLLARGGSWRRRHLRDQHHAGNDHRRGERTASAAEPPRRYSGPALLPIALRCVYEIHQALPDTPIIGTGGITTGADAIAMLMAGATLVGVGLPSTTEGRKRSPSSGMRWRSARQHGYETPAAVHALAHRQLTFDLHPACAHSGTMK